MPPIMPTIGNELSDGPILAVKRGSDVCVLYCKRSSSTVMACFFLLLENCVEQKKKKGKSYF